MHITVGRWRPIACSKCGSLKAVKPLNEFDIDIRCLDCGHEKKVPPPPSQVASGAISATWIMPKDENPTF